MKPAIKIVLIVLIVLLTMVISSNFWGPMLRDYLKGGIENFFRKSSTEQSQVDQTATAPAKLTYPKMIVVGMDDLSQPQEVVKKIKEVGANTVLMTLVVPLGIPAKSSSPKEITSGAQSMVKTAYQNGLAVGILIDQVGNPPGSTSYEEIIASHQAYIQEYAKFAQEYQMAYLQVAGEVDGILRMTSHESRTGDLIKAFLETAKANYAGEIGIGFDICMGANYDQCPIKSLDYDLTEYDFTSTSVYLNGKNIPDPAKRYLETFTPIVGILRTANDKYGVKKIYQIVNAGSIWETGKGSCEERNNLCYPLTPEEEKDFYQKLLPKAKEISDGLIISYFAINNRPGEKVIREFLSHF